MSHLVDWTSIVMIGNSKECLRSHLPQQWKKESTTAFLWISKREQKILWHLIRWPEEWKMCNYISALTNTQIYSFTNVHVNSCGNASYQCVKRVYYSNNYNLCTCVICSVYATIIERTVNGLQLCMQDVMVESTCYRIAVVQDAWGQCLCELMKPQLHMVCCQ